jgi:hypothetical protein
MYFVYFDPLLENTVCGLGKLKSDNSVSVDFNTWEILFSNPQLLNLFYFDGEKIREKPTYLNPCTDGFFNYAYNLEFGNFEISKGLIIKRNKNIVSMELPKLDFNDKERATKFPIYIEKAKTGSLLFSKTFYVKDLLTSPWSVDCGIFPISIFSQNIFKNENH